MTRFFVVVFAALAVAGAALARSADSTKIVPWHQIGDAGLNATRADVVARYGRFKGDLGVFKAAQGGELDVALARNVVVNLSEDSPRYRTPDGITVGMKTPATSPWKGFTFVKDFQSWQRAVCFDGIYTLVNLDTEMRVIRRVAITFAAGVRPGLKPRQPLTAADRAAIEKASKPAT